MLNGWTNVIPTDNADAESFFKTLKNEEVYLWENESVTDVVERIPEFIENVYNEKRTYVLAPSEFEAILRNKKRSSAQKM